MLTYPVTCSRWGMSGRIRGGAEMAVSRTYDVIIAGGGIAGSSLAGILARAGLGVLLIEREARYRDRIRGELTMPWGVA